MNNESTFTRHPRKTLTIIVVLGVVLLDLVAGTALNAPMLGRLDIRVHHGLSPNFEGPREKWGPYEYRVTTNSLGLVDVRKREIPQRDQGSRILFLGDSFTFGLGVPYDTTFVNRVAQAMASRGIEVLNGGVVSYSPKLYWLRAEDLIVRQGVAIDEIAVFIDVSDAQDEIVYEHFMPGLTLRNMARATYVWLLRHSYFFHNNEALTYAVTMAIRKLTMKLPGPNTDQVGILVDSEEAIEGRVRWVMGARDYDDWGRRGLELAAANMDRLIELARLRGIRLTLAVYPWPFMVGKPEYIERHAGFWRRFAGERGVPLLDLSPAFEQLVRDHPGTSIDAWFLADRAHWNPEGHGVVAQAWLAWRNGLGPWPGGKP